MDRVPSKLEVFHPICTTCSREIRGIPWLAMYGDFCNSACKDAWIEKAVSERKGKEPMQLPLPFPPSAITTPTETLKVKVKQEEALPALITQWYEWLLDPRQTIYNRVEMKWHNCYFVIAKLKPEEEK